MDALFGLLRSSGDPTGQGRTKSMPGFDQDEAAAVQYATMDLIKDGVIIANERSRISAVFGSPASYGRERVCAKLLASHQGWSAAAITRELPKLATDRDLAAGEARKTTASDAVWAAAYASAPTDAEPEKPSSAASKSAADVWDRVYAKGAANEERSK